MRATASIFSAYSFARCPNLFTNEFPSDTGEGYVFHCQPFSSRPSPHNKNASYFKLLCSVSECENISRSEGGVSSLFLSLYLLTSAFTLLPNSRPLRVISLLFGPPCPKMPSLFFLWRVSPRLFAFSWTPIYPLFILFSAHLQQWAMVVWAVHNSMLLYYFASAVKSIQFHVDDDIIDKLNYYYTTAIITGKLFFAYGKRGPTINK